MATDFFGGLESLMKGLPAQDASAVQLMNNQKEVNDLKSRQTGC